MYRISNNLTVNQSMYVFSKLNALILTQSREEEQRDVCEHVAGVWVQPLL